MSVERKNNAGNQLAALSAATVFALAACTEKSQLDNGNNSEEQLSLSETFCQAAASDEAKELLQIEPEEITSETCLSDEQAGVIGQYVISLELDGPVTDSAEMAITLIDEQVATESDQMPSFEDLQAGVPADDVRTVEISGQQREVLFGNNGMAANLGANTLMVSIEPSGADKTTEGAIIPTIDPGAVNEPAGSGVLPVYADYLTGQIGAGY